MSSFAGSHREAPDPKFDLQASGHEDPAADLIVAHRYYDIQKFVTVWNYSYDAFVFGVNRNFYNSLDKKTQEMLRQAALEAAAYETSLARESARRQIEILKEKGMEVTELSSGEVKAFRARVDPRPSVSSPSLSTNAALLTKNPRYSSRSERRMMLKAAIPQLGGC